MPDELPVHGQPDVVMRALAVELAGLQSVAAELEGCMADVVQRSGYTNEDTAYRQVLQDFDLLTQSLDGLREFVVKLALAAEGRPTIRLVEALSTIKLMDMRDRLARQDSNVQLPLRKRAAPKEIDLF